MALALFLLFVVLAYPRFEQVNGWQLPGMNAALPRDSGEMSFRIVYERVK
ncbi:hypothetical protein [Serratia marcescens]|nr:hypothetical protein [Serratia marcescens]